MSCSESRHQGEEHERDGQCDRGSGDDDRGVEAEARFRLGAPSQPTREDAAEGPGHDRHRCRSSDRRRRQRQPLSCRLLDRREAERRPHIVFGGRGGELAANGLGDDEQPSDRRHRRGDAQRGHLDGDRRCDGGTDFAKRRQRLDVDPGRSDDLLDVLDDFVETGGIDSDQGERLEVGDLVGVGAGEALRKDDRREAVVGDVELVADDGDDLDLDLWSVEPVLGGERCVVAWTTRTGRRATRCGTSAENRRSSRTGESACSLTITASRSSTRGSSPSITSGE